MWRDSPAHKTLENKAKTTTWRILKDLKQNEWQTGTNINPPHSEREASPFEAFNDNRRILPRVKERVTEFRYTKEWQECELSMRPPEY